MLQPHNAAVFCWRGATWPYIHRPGKKENLDVSYYFCQWSRQPRARAHHGGAGKPLPFKLPHSRWHQGALLRRNLHVNPKRRAVRNLLSECFRQWWRRFGLAVMEEKESHFADCILRVQESAARERNLSLAVFHALRCLVKKNVGSLQKKINTAFQYSDWMKNIFLLQASVSISERGPWVFFSLNFDNSTLNSFHRAFNLTPHDVCRFNKIKWRALSFRRIETLKQ